MTNYCGDNTMSTLSILLLLSGITTIALGACYLDARFQWRLNDWMNGKCSNPFVANNAEHHKRAKQKKDEHIEMLEQRIETLEAIVTEPAYELNKKN